ncbi:outer membrane protein assembly factor BamD [Chitinilyticum piscinae]|uniref:Outer membrane protein assembly factor BamD n=1 Tax=Chitinilyticum piscinae TaxID=2866724 RepID=A0A8J7K8X5_9NEIS|nr:outer membrane protein assembly factor BamD [Chitinilyticum piscinae]MBE9610348.1 outer membrane protein assembly factor BamD [Chitinilyticum piscinae]
MKAILPRFLLSACALALVTACSSTKSPEVEIVKVQTDSADQLFNQGKSLQAAGSWADSNKTFEQLEAKYPYGRYSQQVQLEMAYNYYKDQEPVLALAAIDRFMKQNPAHPSMDYALYLKGLVSFNDSQGFLSTVFPQDMSERDPQAARESFAAFKELVTRYPDSKYAPDATTRMNYLLGVLASYELHVAKYYFKRGAYLAAANRGNLLINTYTNTKQVEQALGLMIQSYDKLGLTTLRDDAKRVLQKNFPNSTAAGDDMTVDTNWWKPF